MSPVDALVVAALVGCAAWPAIGQGLVRLRAALAPRPAATAQVSDVQEWRQAWASQLIQLIQEIEVQGEGVFADPDSPVSLARQLIWQIIGGGAQPPSKK